MFPWIASLLPGLAPRVIAWAIELLEDKYPGIKPALDNVIGYIEEAENRPLATQTMASHIENLVSLKGH